MHVKEQGPWDHKKKNGKKMAVIVRQGRRNMEARLAPGLTLIWMPTYYLCLKFWRYCLLDCCKERKVSMGLPRKFYFRRPFEPSCLQKKKEYLLLTAPATY